MSGERAQSRLTLQIEVVHDGAAAILGRHMAVELEDNLAAWGCVQIAVHVIDVETVHEGDALLRSLPTIVGRR